MSCWLQQFHRILTLRLSTRSLLVFPSNRVLRVQQALLSTTKEEKAAPAESKETDNVSEIRATTKKAEIVEEELDFRVVEKGRRFKIIDTDTSIKYMQSEAYKSTYGVDPIWKKYVRNFKGHYPPNETRKMCIRAGVYATSSPCTICRDEYLILHHTNIELLKQFIHPYTGEMLPTKLTNICQKQYQNLQIAVTRARDHGLLTMPLPFRQYDYSLYYPQLFNRRPTADYSILLQILREAQAKGVTDVDHLHTLSK